MLVAANFQVIGCSSPSPKGASISATQEKLVAVDPDRTSQADAISIFGVPSKKLKDGSAEHWQYFDSEGHQRLVLYFDLGPTVSRLLWTPNPTDGFVSLDAAVKLFPGSTFREEIDPPPPPHSTERMIRLFDDVRGIQILATYRSKNVEAIALTPGNLSGELRTPSTPDGK